MNKLYTLTTLIYLLFLGCSKEEDTLPTLDTTFTVTFESNGGNVISTQTVDNGKKATVPNAPTKTGDVFDGWFTEAGLTNAFNFDTPITQNTTLYAKWNPEPPTTFTVTFESNGGTAVDTQTIEDGKKATEPSTTPTKTGDVFDGWFTEAGLTNSFNFDTPITQNIILYAKWRETFNIPDANFRTALKNSIPNAFNENDELIINHTDVSTLTEISCNNKNIGSLEGIQFFIALTELNCGYNQLTNLKLSNNTALERLDCYSNQLTSLDLSNNTALERLDCYNNQLTSLDLSNNTALERLDYYKNQLTSLDLSNNTALIELKCSSNQLTALDLSNNTALEKLYCSDNQLTSLDLSNNTALERLYCSDNQLTNLDISNNTTLNTLSCNNTRLTNLDISNNTALEKLYCSDNQLTNLDISNNNTLEGLDCSKNQLTSLDLSNNTVLDALVCYSNQLTSLDLSNNTVLKGLDCSKNQLTNLDLRGIRQIEQGYILNFDINDDLLNSIKIHDNLKNYPIIKEVKTNQVDDLKIEVYTADSGSTNYTKTCSDYNPNSETCTTP